MTWHPSLGDGPGATPGGLPRRFRIVVDGVAYLVDVEEVPLEPDRTPLRPLPGAIGARPPGTHVAQGAAPFASRPAPREAGGRPDEDPSIRAPMPGVVISVAVEPGRAIRPGDVVAVLSAMKMENEVRSPRAGTVSEVRVSAGQAVNAGDVIATLAPAVPSGVAGGARVVGGADGR